MAYPFPSEAWVMALVDVLNSDERYAEVAKKWEGDLVVIIEADPKEEDADLPIAFYFDLWHGSCRSARYVDMSKEGIPKAAYVLSTPMANIMRILRGELDPMQAMLTRKLKVKGNLGYMLRNVPTVLDFVRCCQLVEIADEDKA